MQFFDWPESSDLYGKFPSNNIVMGHHEINRMVDIEFSYQEMESKGLVCEDIERFISFMLEMGNEIELCGIKNPKAPDPYIYLKHRMDYSKTTVFVDKFDFLTDDRNPKKKKISRVYSTNPQKHSAEVVYDWESKNDQ